MGKKPNRASSRVPFPIFVSSARVPNKHHPRRPRDSQSGREKRRKFQVRENFRPAFSSDPTDCPWVSEDEQTPGQKSGCKSAF